MVVPGDHFVEETGGAGERRAAHCGSLFVFRVFCQKLQINRASLQGTE